MCGIAGIVHFEKRPVEKAVIQKMTDVIRHRGPDDSGSYFSGRVGLGHRRLSIIDLSKMGHQPMANEDGTVVIVFNGEIYNYRSLNSILAAKGHTIKSACDTETVIHLYEEYGTDCVSYLRGMFSFAIWDAERELLFAAVDRLRIKPFYYTAASGGFIFASELKAILASGYYHGEMNPEALHHYLSLQAIPVPMTIYDRIFTLPGGHCLELKNGKKTVRRYWDMTFPVDVNQTESDVVRKLRDIVSESVEMRLMSDVPLGAFLSGGIDSSVVVGLMKEMTEGPVKTFAIGYDVGGRDYDDTYYADLVAKKFDTHHTVQTVTAADILKDLKNFIWHLDQPSTDAINSYFVSKMAARDVTVVLCGQGGDELFAGYETFNLILRFLRRDRRWENLPEPVRQFLVSAFQRMPGLLKRHAKAKSIERFLFWTGSFVKKYGTIRMDLTEAEKSSVYSRVVQETMKVFDSFDIYQEHYDQLKEGTHPLNKVSYLDMKTHLGDVLMRDVDAMSMAFSLETRIPLIDHKLVEYVGTIPPEMKLKNGRKKHIFLESMGYLLPDEVLNRPKLGFAFPLSIWLRYPLRPLVEFVLSRENIKKRGLFNHHRIKQIKNEFYSGKNLGYRRLWGYMVLEMWQRLVIENDHEFFERLENQVKLADA